MGAVACWFDNIGKEEGSRIELFSLAGTAVTTGLTVLIIGPVGCSLRPAAPAPGSAAYGAARFIRVTIMLIVIRIVNFINIVAIIITSSPVIVAAFAAPLIVVFTASHAIIFIKLSATSLATPFQAQSSVSFTLRLAIVTF